MSTSIDNTHAKTFKAFPEFSKLTFKDRRKYETLTSKYPPIADMSFPMLMTWWNWFDSCAVATLNDNLVVSYWLPGAEEYSGFCILGTNQIDSSICTIFDYLKEKGEPVRLVHEPEFVLASIQYPDLFSPKEERAFDEYIFPVSKFYPLEQTSSFRRRRIRKFLSEINEDRIVVKSLDLSDEDNKRLLLEHAAIWQKKDTIKFNNIAKNENEAMKANITNANAIGVENLCLFIDGELQGFSLHQLPDDDKYVTALNLRLNSEVSRVFDYMLYIFAEWLAEHDVIYINLKYDLGILHMRMFKIALGPCNYFRKYTIKPVG